MAYDEGLAQRLRETLDDRRGLSEKKMFGGVGFMINGNMACGVIKDDLIVRVGPEQHGNALSQPNARKFDFTGRPMKGWVMVSAPGYESDEDLVGWVGRGTDFAESLPEK